MSLFDKIGPDQLRTVLVDFYDRVFDDLMIGFLFIGKDRQRLIDKECELTARFLGGDDPYTGRPLRAAHARVPIMGGHFDRRLQILRETLADHRVDEEVQRAWIEHNQALRGQVTSDPTGACNDVSAARFTGADRADRPGRGDQTSRGGDE
ncbi:group I truncated hemoglobin [Haliangium sp.]|uniref:group I truncated hemoglobin n=1 Tax=Haliangium sp. TaxID=2663208 RepID=UPI003D0AC8F7